MISTEYVSQELLLDRGWKILQDVHGHGEELRLFDGGFENADAGPQISEWEPLERLAHLQTVLSSNPYFGRELRYFNQTPWWYRHEFCVPADAEGKFAVLRFEAVDYYCKVWLNGIFLGSHQGYATPFEFDVSNTLTNTGTNLLIVKVWSPWDTEILGGSARDRAFNVLRGMAKGTYEHDDTFIQRDVNPVGIWKPVRLYFHDGIRFSGRLRIDAVPSGDGSLADIDIVSSVETQRVSGSAVVTCRIFDGATGGQLASAEKLLDTENKFSFSIEQPKLWNVWDRGGQPMYRAVAEILDRGRILSRTEETFGIRTAGLVRSEQETCFILNGSRIFLRGTAYFPDVYLSEMHEARYRRDMELVKSAGFNAIRVHVHTPHEFLLDICDEMGIAVLQDFDINWAHPSDAQWSEAAASCFAEVVRELRNHPSIFAWVSTNEPAGGGDGSLLNSGPGPQLLQSAAMQDPGRPVIRGSGAWGDPLLSGDTHNYTGSLDGHSTHYTDIFNNPANKWGFAEKLNTEFGFDAPGALENLKKVPRLFERLQALGEEGIREIQYYQYRLLKYYIEHYRAMKYSPCAGYFQFMFIDLCPQSFYGVFDWWGAPKQGARALMESNGPVGVFMLYKDSPGRLFAVNDTLRDLAGCVVEWQASDVDGNLVNKGSRTIDLPPDSLVEFGALDFPVRQDRNYTILLSLRDPSGMLLAQNRYEDAFHHPAHPKGHPHRMSHELGMRLFWA